MLPTYLLVSEGRMWRRYTPPLTTPSATTFPPTQTPPVCWSYLGVARSSVYPYKLNTAAPLPHSPPCSPLYTTTPLAYPRRQHTLAQSTTFSSHPASINTKHSNRPFSFPAEQLERTRTPSSIDRLFLPLSSLFPYHSSPLPS